MKFGVREAVDVTFKAYSKGTIGNMTFEKNQPVLLFDTLKTTGLEQAVTTVYAQGGMGNPRLIGWDGDKAITLTMEDALLSPMSMAILANAGLYNASNSTVIYKHERKQMDYLATGTADETNYTLTTDTSTVITTGNISAVADADKDLYCYVTITDKDGEHLASYPATTSAGKVVATIATEALTKKGLTVDSLKNGIIVDYYVEKKEKATQIEIESSEFKGMNFRVEGTTLFRMTDGQDYKAQIIIPRIKVQSNMSFSMSGSGDPSTFTFTCDAFPAKVWSYSDKEQLASIEILGEKE